MIKLSFRKLTEIISTLKKQMPKRQPNITVRIYENSHTFRKANLLIKTMDLNHYSLYFVKIIILMQMLAIFSLV